MTKTWCALLVLAGLVGCGGSGATAETTASGADTSDDTGGERVEMAPTGEATLRGTVGGAPWEARTAVAGHSVTGDDARAIALYPFEISCADLAEGNWPEEASYGTRDVSITVSWVDGFSGQPDGTFERSRSSDMDVGSVTVLRAAARGRLRLEMQSEDPSFDAIAGEIDVIDCGPEATVRAWRLTSSNRLALAR